MAERTNSPNFDAVHESVALFLVAALAFAVMASALRRIDPRTSPVIELDRATWACTAEHVKKRAVVRGYDTVEIETKVVCDAWGRR